MLKKPLILVAAVASAGCLHTKEVEKGTEGYAQAEKERSKSAEPKRAKAAAKSETKGPQASGEAPKPKQPTSSANARAPAEEGRPELSVSPQGLMFPEGPRLIQQALSKRGYLPSDHQSGELDAETSGALRKFQGDEKLARTGSPVRETVRRLGLSVEKIFRSSKPNRPNS